jgi:hypothetical protein
VNNFRRKALLGALTALLVLVGSTAAYAAATLYGPKAAPNGQGDPAWYRASEWNSGEPTWYGSTDWWITSAPADSSPDLKRRSEIKFGASQAAVQLDTPGYKTQWKGYLKPVLGAAKNDGRSWHSLVQLHGPDTDGGYRFAQFALRVVNGYWQAWGDNNDGVTAWSQNLMPYVDDYATYATITYKAASAPSLGLVCITLDPAASSSGDPAAQSWCHSTASWDSQWLVWSSGLYRGSGSTPFDQGGIQPTYEQHVFQKFVEIAEPYL